VDFELNDDQTAIVEAIEALLVQHAGAARAIALAPKSEYDAELERLLCDSGFMGVARGEDTGPLEAALALEAVAGAAAVVSAGPAMLVVPGIGEREFGEPVALATSDHRGPIRFLAHARTLLILDGEEARAVVLEPGDGKNVASNFGYPMGTISPDRLREGESLGEGSGERLRSWWRVALAVEAVGNMRAALDCTVDYLKQRKQFGRTIGSFQAVAHRLANCAIAVEGSRWLALEAAYHGAPAQMSSVAAAYGLETAGQVFAETHQLSGAIGFTREHDLHVWSMRLQALRLELGGVSAHRRALAEARWGPTR
jgi:alkylation response protein AidB-like acyl-CoA dehydrogenase